MKELSRVTTSFYISSDINKAWRQYCRVSGKDGCWLLEEAILEFMRNHHQTQTPLFITQDIRGIIPDDKTNIRLKMSKQELRYALEYIDGRETAFIKKNLPRLRRAINRALSLRTTDEELDELLVRAGGYLK